VASLEDLALMKARAWVAGRDKEEQDLGDFRWVLAAMKARGIDYDPMPLLSLLA